MKGDDAMLPWLRTALGTLSALMLVVGSFSLAYAGAQQDVGSAQPAATGAASADGGGGDDHCPDGDSKGHKDCKPENNPNPDDPPCDADHGHPGDNSPKCDDDDGRPPPCPDRDQDGVCDGDDECPDQKGPKSNDGCPPSPPPPCPDQDGDGVCDADDRCPAVPGPPENDGCPLDEEHDPCTAAAGDPGLLTEDTLGQTLWSGGLDALAPLTEDPDGDGVITGPVKEGGEDSELEPVTDEVACAGDLALDEEVSPVDP